MEQLLVSLLPSLSAGGVWVCCIYLMIAHVDVKKKLEGIINSDDARQLIDDKLEVINSKLDDLHEDIVRIEEKIGIRGSRGRH